LRLDGLWVERQRALEQANRFRIFVPRPGLQPCGASLKGEIERIGMLGRPGGLRTEKFEVERDCDPARDLVLQGEQTAHVAIEPLRPQMRISLGIDQLGVYADLAPRSPDAPFQHIAYTQLTANLLGVDGLVPVGERGIARNHETVGDPRQIGRQILGDPVREILLLPIIAEVSKGQHNGRQTRRSDGRRS